MVTTESQGMEEDFSDDEIEEDSHKKLLDAVTKLYRKKKIEAPSRTETTSDVSEFHLSDVAHNREFVRVDDLINALDKKATHKEIKNNVRELRQKSRTIRKPLEKIHADRIKKKIGYESVKRQLTKWDAVIQRNRAAGQLKFPLEENIVEIKTVDSFRTPFKEPTELEQKMSEILGTSEVAQNDLEVEKELLSLNLPFNELLKRRKMIAQMRARESYRIAKAVRQNKIKSKKYHRILKREKIKQALKEFEILQKTNPEAALEKLEKIERARAEERMSLRHRNTGKWARSQAIRAKYNLEARQELADQLAKSRELTRKPKADSDSEVEGDEEEINDLSNNNPWVDKTESEVDNFISGYRKFWDETLRKQKETNEKKDKETSNKNQIEVEDEETTNEKEEEETNDKETSNENRVEVEDEETINEKEEETIEKQVEVEEEMTNEKRVEVEEQDKLDEDDVEVVKEKKNEKGSKRKRRERKRKAKKSKLLNTSGSWSVCDSNEATETNKTKLDNWSINDIFSGVENEVREIASKKFKKIGTGLKPKNKKRNHKKANEESDLAMKKRNVVSVDESLIEINEGGVSTGENDLKSLVDKLDADNKDQLPEIDPNKFLNVKPKALNTEISALEEDGDEERDEKEKHLNLVEAFAEDDIVDQFRKEKEEEAKDFKAKEVDLTLPGWGSWGGAGLDGKRRNKRKKKRFIVKFPEIKRKDEKRDRIIINENVDNKLKKIMVNELPHPFKSVKDYEASIRTPIGNTWVPQEVHSRLTEPPVLTKLGHIIEPMSRDELLKEITDT